MSRRSHHPIRRHVRPRHPEGKRGAPGPEHAEAVAETELASDALSAPEPSVPDEPTDAPTDEPVEEPAAEVSEEPPGAPAEGPVEAPAIEPPEAPAPPGIANETSAPHATGVVTGIVAPAMPAGPSGPAVSPGPPGAATAPQLRRFIKSRSYIPMHELRRRFGIVVEDDDVAAIDLGGHRVYVGLPPREGALLGELLRAGDVGYEASFDPVAPIIVGVFPIRPVTRG